MSKLDLFSTPYTTEESIKSISEKLHEPQWLLERRIDAFNDYLKLPFDQDTLFYKYTNFRKFDPKKLQAFLNLDTLNHLDENNIDDLPVSYLENENANQSYLNNDQGVFFGNLVDFISLNEEKAREIISEVDSVSKSFDKLGMLSRAMASSVAILYVPKNVIVKDLLVKLTTMKSSKISLYTEFIGYFDEGSQVSMLDQFFSEHLTDENLFNSLYTLIVKDNAKVTLAQIQNWDQKTVHNLARVTKIERYGVLRSLTHMQGGLLSRVNSNIDLAGQGSEGYDLFVKFGSDKQRFDIKSELHHNGRDTIGNVHARTVMMDKSESILRGMISIPEPGVNADSWLTSQGMTLDKGKIVAIPALNIDQNDVQAAHAASVEPLNEEVLFYLQSRGVPQNKSRELMVKGYFEYILKQINNEKISDLSRNYLSSKWDANRG
ncbi:MAG: SufD family Fe-S cluster assembly protein [Candidatus Heimdallarchaeota archaeon]|nr:SufD family Fe-S cluster assembly protein [Candidatus Heimdallarchaeota archaeon]